MTTGMQGTAIIVVLVLTAIIASFAFPIMTGESGSIMVAVAWWISGGIMAVAIMVMTGESFGCKAKGRVIIVMIFGLFGILLIIPMAIIVPFWTIEKIADIAKK